MRKFLYTSMFCCNKAVQKSENNEASTAVHPDILKRFVIGCKMRLLMKGVFEITGTSKVMSEAQRSSTGLKCFSVLQRRACSLEFAAAVASILSFYGVAPQQGLNLSDTAGRKDAMNHGCHPDFRPVPC